jgi:hypothetical protein
MTGWTVNAEQCFHYFDLDELKVKWSGRIVNIPAEIWAGWVQSLLPRTTPELPCSRRPD